MSVGVATGHGPRAKLWSADRGSGAEGRATAGRSENAKFEGGRSGRSRYIMMNRRRQMRGRASDLYDEPEMAKRGGFFKTYDEAGSPKDAGCLRYMMNQDRQMRGCAQGL